MSEKKTLDPGPLADVSEWLAQYGLVVITAEEHAELTLFKSNAVMGGWHRKQKIIADSPATSASQPT